MPDDDATREAPNTKNPAIPNSVSLTKPARVWYALMNVGLGSGYFAKIPAKKALSEAGMTKMTSAESFWYRLMCVSFGMGYFLKVPAVKAISESMPKAPGQGPVGIPTSAPSKPIVVAGIAGAAAVAVLTVLAAVAGLRTLGSSEQPASPDVAAKPLWHLNGIYRVDIDFPRGTLRTKDGELIDMATLNLPPKYVLVARRSACNPDGSCDAVSVTVDDVTHTPKLDVAATHLRWTGTQWVTNGDGPHHGTIAQNPCADDGMTSDTWESWNELTALVDGAFAGTFHQEVMTDECGLAGDNRTVPMTATRIADAPDGTFG